MPRRNIYDREGFRSQGWRDNYSNDPSEDDNDYFERNRQRRSQWRSRDDENIGGYYGGDFGSDGDYSVSDGRIRRRLSR